ncbi:MAG TPA: hypothetical protein PLV68_09140, partial [Ilumatobacteraceae bacterium]|nr:hypothetical protein [Ilumatobacteraceae bacterium]
MEGEFVRRPQAEQRPLVAPPLVASQRGPVAAVQRVMRVGAADDRAEREADVIADEIVGRLHDGTAVVTPSGALLQSGDDDGAGRIRRSAMSPIEVAAVQPAARIQRLTGSAHQPAEAQHALVQRAAITTFGGTFDTAQYEAVSAKPAAGKQTVGGVIDLAFTPNDLVDGKVGLVQTGKAKRGGAVDIGPNDHDKRARAQKAGGDEGRFLDRSNYKDNPIFGMEASKTDLAPIDEGVGISMTTDITGKPSEGRNLVAKDNKDATVTKADPAALVDPARTSARAGVIGANNAVDGAT